MPGTTKKTYRFNGILEQFQDGIKYHYVRFPFPVEGLRDAKGRVRMVGTVNGISIDRGLIPDGNNGYYIILGGALRKQAGLRLGNTASFVLSLHESPGEVEIPEELEAAFDQEPEGRRMYDKITPGLQRSVLSYITSAKTPETRAKRAAFLLERFLSGYYLRGKHKQAD